MNKGIELWTINKWLRKIGLVLVISTSNDGPTRLWIERSKTYDYRIRKAKENKDRLSVEEFLHISKEIQLQQEVDLIEQEIEDELFKEDEQLVWQIHKNCTHLPHADCLCPEETRFDREREMRRLQKRRERGLK